MWYTHQMECYLIIKIDKILTPATAWMSLRIITLSERSPKKKNPTLFHFYKHLKNSNECILTESRSEVALGKKVRNLEGRDYEDVQRNLWEYKYIHYLTGVVQILYFKYMQFIYVNCASVKLLTKISEWHTLSTGLSLCSSFKGGFKMWAWHGV